ncbi:C4-dicarboxylate ABC transporter permease [Methylobacterium sp. Leaf125]|uniref:TRAP transporter small permease n=1 Tax=unclassified Methylobacterium TaxID=2615210 RepID=UPI0006F48D1A|nr:MULTISPECIES: TRAP transporter small permease [unclassified Methylobacterium]KQQ47829.1 C4-dicarboxylate ABC transporter permease [Methylobacterium sp. Leaf125]POR41916.1 TRAP transporter small permease [Methylobacterium sp. V23]
MSHAFDAASAAAETHTTAEPRVPGLLGTIDRALKGVNHVIMLLGGIALVCACLVLSYSVVIRYVLHEPTDWQDEMAVFLIVGATFFSAAAVQAKRGHVAIEALTGLLSPRVNRARLLVADVISFIFVAFFAWKSWTLLHEAWVDGQVSQSSWGPPLWIPYILMAIGMTLLGIQFALQIAEEILYGAEKAGWANPKIGLGADLNRDTQGHPGGTPTGTRPLGDPLANTVPDTKVTGRHP